MRRVSSLCQHQAKGSKACSLGEQNSGTDMLCVCQGAAFVYSGLCYVRRCFYSVCPCRAMRLWVTLVRFPLHESVWISESPRSSQLMANHYGSWQMPSSRLPRQPQRLHPSWLGRCLRNGLLSKPSLSLMAPLIGATHKWIRIGQNCDLGAIHNSSRTHISRSPFFF